MKKILYITLISLLLIFSLTNNVFAVDTQEFYNVIENPGTYKPGTLTYALDADQIKDMANRIIGAIQVIGTILSVSVLGVLGIKYMVGSVDERADYKKTLRPYLIGAIMVKIIEVLF